MKLNPLSLSFAKDQSDLEKAYLDRYFNKSISIFRFCMIISVFFYCLVAFLDYQLFPEQFPVLFFIRFGVVLPAFVIGFIFSFHRYYKKLWPIINNFFVVLTGVGFIVMIAYCPPPLNYSYYVGVIICSIFGYTFIRSRFLMATITNVILFTIFTLVSIAIKTPKNILLLNLYFMFCINILGMIISYTTEIYMRRDFFLGKLLEKEREHIENANERLEKIVLKRTEELSKSNINLKEEIRERKELETRLVQAKKMEAIGKLAGGIAHDFNNILYPIIGYAELLLLDTAENSPIKDRLEKIHSGATRAGDLVKQILTFSRQGERESKLLEIRPVVEEALTLMRTSVPFGVKIVQEIEKECGLFKGDPTQIHQMIMNLTTNAYHAMEETGGTLRVKLEKVDINQKNLITPDMPTGTYVCLSVSDSGTGMTKEVEKRVFDPFFTTKEPGKGTGMGLAVVHGIVEKSGGTIQISTVPDSGTRVLIYLPIEKTPVETEKLKKEDTLQKGTGNILVVDDEELIVTMEKLWLERLGYTVTAYENSEEALKSFRATPDKFDLVVTDMNMPNLNGQELSSEMLKIRSDILIIMCTGYNDKLSQNEAAAVGIQGYLMKPVKMEEFSNKIHSLLTNDTHVKSLVNH